MKYVQRKFILILLRLILVSIVILVGAGIVLNIGNETHSRKNDELFMIDQRLSSLFFEINNFPRGPGQDVVFLSQLASLKSYISAPGINQTALDQTAKDFQSYLKQSEAYYSIRFIDLEKMDRDLYISRDIGKRTEARHFSNSGEDNILEYDIVAKKLQEGLVYISPLHRHQENGKIISGMYYITPIFNAAGEREGAVILTVDANYFLEDIRNYSKPGEMIYLIDSKGFYLAHPDQKKEFVASQDGLGSFVNDYPDISEKALSSNERRLENGEYIFSLRRIYPTASSFEMHDESRGEGSYYWILVSVYEKPAMLSGISFLSGDFFVKYLMVFISVLVLAIVGILGTRYLAPRNSKDDENL